MRSTVSEASGSTHERTLAPNRAGATRVGRPSERAAELTRVAWRPRGDMALEEWSAVGRRFGEIGRCSQWWLGDWIHYGNQRFGERYTRAVKLTGYDAQSLMNMVYVASRFEFSRRRENLSWSHHATLAALDRDSQERWLDRAVAQRLSVADLRIELRGRRRVLEAAVNHAESGNGNVQLPRERTRRDAVVCPNCGGRVPVGVCE
jgi:hypothetical protein